MDILIVEDNKEIGKLLETFLRKENYIVSVAESGEKAMRLFEMYGAKVVILDIMLPGIDGFAICSKIRETSNAHILIASARTDKDDKLKGLNLGADDYIEKPYDIDVLIAKINGIFKRKYARETIVEDGRPDAQCVTSLHEKGLVSPEKEHAPNRTEAATPLAAG